MNKISFYRWSYLSFLGLLSTIILEILTSSRYAAFAQSNIIPDDTLGKENSIVVPLDSAGFSIDAISGGATRGINLFHSFKEFNVGEGRSSYFLNNDNNLQNILTRVTGNNPSNILGTLGISNLTGITSNPNLYLINPNGIVFGENASLDVSDSFVATTANGIQFGKQGVFSATNLEKSSLLSVAPGALFFQQVRSQPGNIINRGNLAVGKDFTVAADNLDLQGQLLAGGNLKLQGTDKVKVRDSLTNPFIAAAKGELLVQGNQSVDIFALKHPDSGFFSGGDMVLRSANQVGGDAKYWSGGSFRIEQLDGSLGDLFSPYDPVIRSLGDVSFNNYGGSSLHIFAAGSVTVPGSIFITNPETGISGENFIAENITLSNGTVLPIDGSLKPTLDIRAGVDSTQVGVPTNSVNEFPNNFFYSRFVNLSGSSFPIFENPVSSNTATSGDIKINDINMLAADGTVFLTNNYKPNTAISGGNIEVGRISTNDGNGQFLGNSGSIIFDGRSNITLTDRVNSGSASGNSGDITLLADGDISLKDNAVLVANTRGAGSGGNIFIQANGLVSLSNSAIITNVTSDATGKGGDITVNANSVSLTDKALIDASTFGRGNAGQILINADGAVSLESNSSILNNIEEEKAIGSTAGINIEAKTVTLSGNSQITSLVDGEGKAGNITIKADDSVVLSGNNNLLNSVITTRIASNTGPNRDGKTGDITIQTGSLDLNGAVITNSTFGNGNTGKISIEADKDILLSNNAAIFSSISAANSGVFANSDDITIDAKSLTLDSSSIQTVIRDASGEFNPVKGNSGNININLSGDLKITAGDTGVYQGIVTSVADGAEGKAGDIRITARDFSIAGTNAQVRSTLDSFAIGEGGNIDVKVRNLNLTQASEIFSFTAGKGNAGNISIEVTDNIILNDSSVISSGVVQGGNGNGGNISLKAGSLSFTDGSQLQSTVGIPLGGEGTENLEPAQGNAGNIDVNISNKAVLEGLNSNRVPSGISSAIFSEVGGKGGDINIQTPFLYLNNGGVVTAASSGNGNAGNINISVDNLLNMKAGNIFTTSGKSSGGNIDVKAQDIRLFSDSDIRTNVFSGTGGGGNINLTANTIVALDDSDILSFARDGKGGDITFNTNGFFSTPLFTSSPPTTDAATLNALDNNSRVDVNASGTVNGAVTGVPDVTFIDDELTDLPDSQIDTNSLIANSCIARGNKRQENSFTITGSGGLRNSPGDGFVSTYSTGDVRNVSENNQSSEWKKGEPIIEPQGVYKLASGELILSRECS
ncbi:filamentous hemagglutinin N-terminal domain-containing protein [Rivularia sp. UHCC 0363]|uniref:two-partner secretion domain-containing protein n=1 Tax=Rivularia sp. UHCC 0363 TaxID=3110244 RepID=UPI002B2159DE|nr:filamentous hemagglutinin N-terminal domain-containing protein [Rivularia sp. UHCC 0363]MEA5596754.1 filamentous hemagglutinin N-terminal domain-containing protein [Rivularia sp. UHCC 0363]